MNKIILIVLFFAIFAPKIWCQDIHSSLNPLSPQLNPALTGMLRGDYTRRFQVSHRNQWAAVMANGAYSTTQASYEQAFFIKEKDFLGLAASGFYDQAGKMPLRQSQININASFIKNLGSFGNKKYIFLAGGAQTGLAWRRFDFSQISWSEQFTGTGYNITLPTGEAVSLSDFPNRLYGDAGVGIALTYNDNNHYLQRGKLVWLNIGGSLGHIGGVLNTKISNVSAFRDTIFLLRERWSVHTSAMFGLNNNFYLIPTAFVSMQARTFQINTGLFSNIRWGNNSRFLAANAIQIGFLTRFNQISNLKKLNIDALIPSIRFDFGQFTFGTSYDINTSILRQGSYGRGGFEFNFAWLWFKQDNNAKPKKRQSVPCPTMF